MTEQRPVEPSDVYGRDGERLPLPGGGPDRSPALGHGPAASLARAMARAVTAGPMLTASAVAVAAVAAVKVAEAAGRMAFPGAADAWRDAGGAAARAAGRAGESLTPDGGLYISWTHVEIRWPPAR